MSPYFEEAPFAVCVHLAKTFVRVLRTVANTSNALYALNMR